MKKLLLLTALLFSAFFFAQQSKFSGNYSTKSLKEIHKTIPESEKSEFYKQYYKAKVFEQMKDTFKNKSYSDIVLKKFADTIFSYYDGGEIINNDNAIFKPRSTWEEHLQSYNNLMVKDPEEEVKYLAKTLKFNTEKEKQEYLLEMKDILVQQKKDLKKSPEELKKEYTDLVTSEKEQFENDPSTSMGRKKIILKLDQALHTDDYPEDFEYLLQQNLNPQIGYSWYFPSVSAEPNESSIYETIPGEILTYVTETGVAMGRHFMSYKINGTNINPINPYPTDDNFYNIVAKYAKKGWRMEGRAFYDITKNKNGEYVIANMIYTEDDANCCPSYSLEYKTKDFKNFTPLRIAKNEDEKLVWKEIK